MYKATVIKVMIASPSDVATERQVIRDVVHEWNAVHSEDKQLVLMPIGWDTHAAPGMGDRAQALINKHVLAGCDLLVAMFWTRIGSPTGVSPSGTVEEIDEHLKSGKPAMIYFSLAPVRLDSVDDSQYKALLAFRAECERRGLVEEYESPQEFREKFARQLTQTVIRDFADTTEASEDEASEFASAQANRGRDPIVAKLSEEARELLINAAKDTNGTIMRLETLGGLGIQTNGRQFAERGNPRSEATWAGALDRLRELDLVQDAGHKGQVFRLTDTGYEIADRIRAGIGGAT